MNIQQALVNLEYSAYGMDKLDPQERIYRDSFYRFISEECDHVLVSRTVNINNLRESPNVQISKLSIGI